ncbi:unnamed protein product [Effrenium voratum]|nr:unnamed protein product [Effrenium voratum]
MALCCGSKIKEPFDTLRRHILSSAKAGALDLAAVDALATEAQQDTKGAAAVLRSLWQDVAKSQKDELLEAFDLCSASVLQPGSVSRAVVPAHAEFFTRALLQYAQAQAAPRSKQVSDKAKKSKELKDKVTDLLKAQSMDLEPPLGDGEGPAPDPRMHIQEWLEQLLSAPVSGRVLRGAFADGQLPRLILAASEPAAEQLAANSVAFKELIYVLLDTFGVGYAKLSLGKLGRGPPSKLPPGMLRSVAEEMVKGMMNSLQAEDLRSMAVGGGAVLLQVMGAFLSQPTVEGESTGPGPLDELSSTRSDSDESDSPQRPQGHLSYAWNILVAAIFQPARVPSMAWMSDSDPGSIGLFPRSLRFRIPDTRAIAGTLAMTFLQNLTPSQLLFAAAALRIILIVVAEVQDVLAEVPYTDVDYQVFSDAAESVSLGLSPYNGRTALLANEATRYRYTPLLAYMLLPNLWVKAWGKVLFSSLDVVAGVLLTRGCLGQSGDIRFRLALWLFNPFCFTISTRGSGESVVVVLVYALLYFLESNWQLSAVIFGLAVHWRMYPVIYLPALAMHLPFRKLLGFCVVSFMTFASLALVFYLLYGMEFIECAYLHHSKRRDPQHNFSVYFYPTALYLEAGIGFDVARFAALPQLLLCTLLGTCSAVDLPQTFLLQTLAFVATNKVVTAQYFVWWLCLLPAMSPGKRLLRGLALWMAAEIHWLLWAYLLEFRQLPVRPGVWLASCGFLAAQLHLLWQLWTEGKSGAGNPRLV